MKEIYIIYARKRQLKFAMFLSVYWLFNLLFLLVAMFKITSGAGVVAVINGVIHLVCLFLSAMWIEELLNEND